MQNFSKRMASPVGTLTLVATDKGLAAILWENDRPGRVRLSPSKDGDNHPVLLETERQLLEYFAGRRKNFALTLDVSGTPFQRKRVERASDDSVRRNPIVRADRPTDREPRGGARGRRRQRQKPGLDCRAVPSSRRRLGCAHGFCRRSRCQGTAVTSRASPARRPHALTYHCTFRSRG